MAVFGVLAAACTPSPSADDPTTTTTTSGDTTTTSTVIEPSADACVSGDLPFESDGLVAAVGEPNGDAARVTQIRWEGGAACERIVVGFSTDTGAPAARLGVTGVTVLAFAGIVRVDLPDAVSATAIADTLVEGSVVDRAYVIRDDAGAMAIDIHATPGVAIAARAVATGSPATLVIDVIPIDGPPPVGATSSQEAVVVTPPPGPNLYPFTVEAYAPPGIRSIRVILSGGETPTTNVAIALDGLTDAWQAVATRIVDGPSGSAVLYVGNVDAEDRPLDGASVSLDLP